MLWPVVFLGQTVMPTVPVKLPAGIAESAGRAEFEFAPEASPANLQSSQGRGEALRSGSENTRDKAFLNAAPQSEKGKSGTGGKITPIILSLAVHAAVTWDAQSTNHFFRHYPQGYLPVETDPLMRPFAGKASMYPMANLLFAIPVDLILFKTGANHSRFRVFTYAAASCWAGMEIHQSIVNMGNEHIKSGK